MHGADLLAPRPLQPAGRQKTTAAVPSVAAASAGPPRIWGRGRMPRDHWEGRSVKTARELKRARRRSGFFCDARTIGTRNRPIAGDCAPAGRHKGESRSLSRSAKVPSCAGIQPESIYVDMGDHRSRSTGQSGVSFRLSCWRLGCETPSGADLLRHRLQDGGLSLADARL
jgi:hypothetical protein